jgi:hypothetical protein
LVPYILLEAEYNFLLGFVMEEKPKDLLPEQLSQDRRGNAIVRVLAHLREHLRPRPEQSRVRRVGEIAASGGMLLVLDDDQYFGSSCIRK